MIHPDARRDLDDIWDYIAADNPDTADKTIAEITDAIRSISPLPERGFRRPDPTARPLRFLRVRDYLIIYFYRQTPPVVIAILHGRRNPRVLAAILRSRA